MADTQEYRNGFEAGRKAERAWIVAVTEQQTDAEKIHAILRWVSTRPLTEDDVTRGQALWAEMGMEPVA